MLLAETATLLADLCQEESKKSHGITITRPLTDRQEQVGITLVSLIGVTYAQLSKCAQQ